MYVLPSWRKAFGLLKSINNSITSNCSSQLAAAATGSFQTVVASSHGISQPSVSRCIRTVTDALCSCAKEFIVFLNISGQLLTQQKFYEKSGFLQVIGCIDGTHIPILAPSQNGDIYVNRKNPHSINNQVICDANLKFIDIVVRQHSRCFHVEAVRNQPSDWIWTKTDC